MTGVECIYSQGTGLTIKTKNQNTAHGVGKVKEKNMYKLNNVEVSKEDIKKLIEEHPEILESEWPKKGDKYYYLLGDNIVYNDILKENDFYEKRKIYGNMFRTKEAAKRELLRREARALAYFPKIRETYKTLNEIEDIMNNDSHYNIVVEAVDRMIQDVCEELALENHD